MHDIPMSEQVQPIQDETRRGITSFQTVDLFDSDKDLFLELSWAENEGMLPPTAVQENVVCGAGA